jgi:hypothetical protein
MRSMILRRPLHTLLVLLGVTAVAISWAFVGLAFYNFKTDPPGTLSSGFLWGDQVFTDRKDFANWLRHRGASYRYWAEHHPQDLAILRGVFYPPRTTRHGQG